MSDIQRKARELRKLIDQYWSLAYAEGEQRRNHDTEDGDAQRVSMGIDSAIRSIASLTPPDGYVLVPVKITKEIEDVLHESFEYGYSAESTWDLAINASSQEVK